MFEYFIKGGKNVNMCAVYTRVLKFHIDWRRIFFLIFNQEHFQDEITKKKTNFSDKNVSDRHLKNRRINSPLIYLYLNAIWQIYLMNVLVALKFTSNNLKDSL